MSPDLHHVEKPVKYFPLTVAHFQHQFGVRTLGESELIVEATEHFDEELTLKRQLLRKHRNYYFQAKEDSLAAQRDVVKSVLAAASWLNDGINQRTRESIEIDDASPLLSIGQHVQEDLTIVGNSEGYPLIAGCVTFPSGWCIEDKLGLSMLDVHATVPDFSKVLYPATTRLMQRLKVGRPVCRMNWGIRASSQLDQSPRHQDILNKQRDLIRSENAGQRCFFRVERQTLERLPTSGDILFAIHTHQTSLAQLTAPQRITLRGVLRTCPAETIRYKGITPMLDAIVEYLDQAR